jgi:hypothetical protein
MPDAAPNRPAPALAVKKINAPGVLARANIMYTAIVAAAAMFASPPVQMAAFVLLIQAAAAAQTATSSKTRGLATVRNAKIDALWIAMRSLKTYVHGLSDAVDSVTGAMMIQSAGLVLSSDHRATKLLFSAVFVPATGMVHLAVNAKMLIGKRPTKKTDFNYAWSTDGGKTWSAGVTTSYTAVDVPSLPSASYLFRVTAIVGRVPTEPAYSAPMIIH